MNSIASRSRILIFLVVFLLGFSANAAKYGLVIGGAPTNHEIHDFARVTASTALGLSKRGDYHVTYLLGDGHSNEKQKYTEELNYVESIAKPSNPATLENVSKAFNTLLNQAKEGDQVEIFIAAHGECKDGDTENCIHEVILYDTEGKPKKFKSDEILKFIKSLDKKGVKTTLVMESCYSGALNNEVRKLKNTCTFLLASKYTGGLGCFGNGERSYKYETSTVEYVNLRYYQNVIDILNKGFYSQNYCYQAVRDAASRNSYDTVNNSFWTSFRKDQNFHRPILSSMSDHSLEIMNTFDPRYDRPLCWSDEKNQMMSLMQQSNYNLYLTYQQMKSEYLELLKEQKKLIDKQQMNTEKPISNRDEKRLVEIYDKIIPLSQEIIKIERQHIYDLQKNKSSSAGDPCERKL